MQDRAISWQDKGLWVQDDPVAVDAYLAEEHSLFDGSVSWPIMALRDTALRHNVSTLAQFARENHLDFAPHGKTSMSPEIFRRQLEAGAWGITVATAHQAMIALRCGVGRVLLAHEVLDPVALRTLLAVRDESEGAEVYVLVDSVESVAVAADAARTTPPARPFPVLIDYGWAGGRTGVRTPHQARDLAERIAATRGLVLAGVSAYEGGLPTQNDVAAYFSVIKSVVGSLRDADLLKAGTIVSAGGSAYFDVVAESFDRGWAEQRGVRVLLRSGAYVSHDDGVYVDKTPFQRIDGSLVPAIEVWAQVVSVPEPGLALLAMGKRDVPSDEGLPVAKRLKTATGDRVLAEDELPLTRLDDQHAYLRVPPELVVSPGDLIACGISHPCTAFDKWRAIPILDDNDVIVDVIRTYF